MCQNKDLREDTQTYREPIELFGDWGYMVMLARSSDEPSSSVLDGLGF